MRAADQRLDIWAANALRTAGASRRISLEIRHDPKLAEAERRYGAADPFRAAVAAKGDDDRIATPTLVWDGPIPCCEQRPAGDFAIAQQNQRTCQRPKRCCD